MGYIILFFTYVCIYVGKRSAYLCGDVSTLQTLTDYTFIHMHRDRERCMCNLAHFALVIPSKHFYR